MNPSISEPAVASGATSAHSTPAVQTRRGRIFVNRLLLRAMLFSMGLIAVGIYRLSADKRTAWRFAKAQARNLARLCGVRVRVRGTDQLGPGPYIFVSNHQSHFDIALLLGYLPGINRFAAKNELFRQPVLGLVLGTLGMIPIDRDDPMASIEVLNRMAAEGHSTIIFPEGTRSRDGTLLPFKKGAFVAAVRLGVPIVPVACKGTAQIMPKGKHLSIVPGDVELVVTEPMPTADLDYADRDRLRDLVRQRIASELATPQS